MNKHVLKTIRDHMPESLKYIVGPIIRNQLIKSKEFFKYYELLHNREELNPVQIKEFQFNQLKQILIHSYNNVTYYKELFDKISFDPSKFSDFDQMEKIPFLTRQLVNENFDKLISNKRIQHGYYIGSTGGSSSVPLKFLLDYDSISKENAFIYYYRKKLEYEFKDKLVSFRQVEYSNRLWKYNPMYNELVFFPIKLSKKTIKDYAKKINEFCPQYLNGYLSAIWYFAKLLEEYDIKLKCRIKGIFLTSENSDAKQRFFIEQFFNASSMTFYGHSERAVIAQEIIPDRYVFDPYYGYTENFFIEKNIYSIVGTGFLNYSMPFIRYKTDDVCTPKNNYYIIEGKRESNVGLQGINDEFIACTALELEDPVFNKITTFQFIQNEKGKADLLIIVNKDFHNSDLEAIEKEINRQTNGIIKINIKIVENLILSQRGKFKRYISTIGRD